MSYYLEIIKDLREELQVLRETELSLHKELKIAERNEEQFGLEQVVNEIYAEIDLISEKIFFKEREIDEAYDNYHSSMEGLENSNSRLKERFEQSNLL